MTERIYTIPESEMRRLLAAANADAALLYLYLTADGSEDRAAQALGMSENRLRLASATLRQMGLWTPAPVRHLEPSSAPVYTEEDVRHEYTRSAEFPAIVGDAQRRLGRVLSTEEVKILLGIYRYLGLAPELISVLIACCIQRSQSRSGRVPSFRMIEKEAYRWSDRGIDTIEQAAAYMQAQQKQQNGLDAVQALLGIRGRRLTQSEEKYVLTWLEWGFSEDVLRLAFDKTCMNVGSLKWPYMNSILKSWFEQGFSTVQQIEQGDRAPQSAVRKKPGYGVQPHHVQELSDFERRALEKMMNGED